MTRRDSTSGGQTEMEEWLSPMQAARLIGITSTRVRQLSLEGKLPFEQTPNGRIYRRGDVEEYARKRAATSRRSENKP